MAHPLDDQTRLTWTPLTRGDLAGVSRLLTAIEHLDEPIEHHSLDALQATFDEANADPSEHAIVGRDASGTVLAYGWNYVGVTDIDPRRVYLTGGVHPGWRHQGMGPALIRWQLDNARQWYRSTWTEGHGPLWVICYVDEKLSTRRRLYEQFGLHPVRWYADLTVKFDAELPQPKTPAGVHIVPFTAGVSALTRLAHNHAFADHWGSQPVDEVSWNEGLTRSAARPEWSWVAIGEGAPVGSNPAGHRTGGCGAGDVVGYAMNSVYEEDWAAQGFSDGWTDRIGVCPDWRGRGVARALLAASMHSFQAAGLAAAGIGVDSDNATSAFQLYESLGYKAGDTMVMYALVEEH